jgi:hypothetical protein
MRFLDLLDTGGEVNLPTLEVITMIVLRECNIECYFITHFCSDEFLLESWDE